MVQCTIRQKQSKNSQKSNSLPCETSITRTWAGATAHRPWAGLTVCVYMDVHASGSRSLPRAATLFYLLMMSAARQVCQRPSSNFPLANFLLSRPNSVEYSNSKTTTLLPSANCKRPLFQGRTGCGGRPSGWHDIVTCQLLVFTVLRMKIEQNPSVIGKFNAILGQLTIYAY